MNFEEYMKDKSVFILNNDKNLEYYESFKILIEKEKEFSMIKYNYHKNLLVLNIAVMECDNNGKYYYDYEIERDCDIIDDFKFIANDLDVTFKFICGLNEFSIDEIKSFLLVSAMYNQLKLRITFNEISRTNKEISIYYSKYLCKTDIKKELMKNRIITPSIIYNQGVCIRCKI